MYSHSKFVLVSLSVLLLFPATIDSALMMAAPFPSPTSIWHTKTYEALSPTRPEISAKGKTVVVTGGGTGIGAETARYFAEAGASRIALLGRREQPLLDTKISILQRFPDIDILAHSTDVTKRNEVDAVFAEFLRRGNGTIDVLVSNAAVAGPLESFRDVDCDAFLSAIYVNVQGSFNVARAFLRYAAPEAVVIDVNSFAAHLNAGDAFQSYSIAKVAVFRMWDSIAFTNPGLSVFHVQPGVVDTDMNRQAGGVAAFGIEDHVSLPASFHVWLASPEARFLKGKFLWANWDVDELKARAKELESNTHLIIGLVGWPFGEDGWKLNVDL